MKTLRIFLASAMMLLASFGAAAQELWLSAEGRTNITNKLRANIEMEHRSRDGFDATSRWSASAGLSYKCLPWLRTGVSYKFLYNRDGGKTTKKGNYIPYYWQQGHRAQINVTGSMNLGKFEVSLREAYQYTNFPGQSVEKLDEDGYPKDDEVIETENRHLMRSRLQLEYKHSKKRILTPYASVELYNNLSDGFASTKVRYTTGTEIGIDKHNSISVFYRFVDRVHSRNTNVIGVSYQYKL
ncbi:MAG: DUF2490 domain-containing protein [Muribaculaceae bacterium]|nr:DUF2490 domain-containing protein [Muribaculaceae bacterium]